MAHGSGDKKPPKKPKVVVRKAPVKAPKKVKK